MLVYGSSILSEEPGCNVILSFSSASIDFFASLLFSYCQISIETNILKNFIRSNYRDRL